MIRQQNYSQTIAQNLKIKPQQVLSTIELLENGATVPFIARYRKEMTGELNEVQISTVRDQLSSLIEFEKRRGAILDSLQERELLTPELQQSILATKSLAILEDLYLPFRPKRRTRSAIAKEKGLEPLAHSLYTRGAKQLQPENFISPDQNIHSAEEALAGARDIIAEWINEDAETRMQLRNLFDKKSIVQSKVVKKQQETGQKFRDYFDWQEDVTKTPGHRILAILRGENEKALTLNIRPPEEKSLEILTCLHAENTQSTRQLSLAIEDCYKRLLAPSLENELRNNLKKKADQEAIKVFAENLRELLLSPPMGQKRVMALDPGFRTGAKLVCLDGQGKLLEHTTIYPTLGNQKSLEAGKTIKELCKKHCIEAIGIGNGTAGRETEQFVRSLELPAAIIITTVDESGASIYSASESARSEFPDHDITVRGSVSIGRRLQDPLAELVKIDPKSIGVGQYQHDVNQHDLKKGLDDVVLSCVNQVGVELNTASTELLSYVSGLGPVLAGNIREYREKNGPFRTKKELLKVPRLGAKAFEQCAGFLRIHEAANPLDQSGVHPECYAVVEQMAKDAGSTIKDLMTQKNVRDSIKIINYVSKSFGVPTLQDILAELAKPGRDPRPPFSNFSFADGIHTIDDLTIGMKLPGIVTNVTKFGAFVDIGVHQDGLIHISQLADRFVKDPGEVIKVRQQVIARILEVDKKRKRIALSLRNH
jgi:uncharacterized protein